MTTSQPHPDTSSVRSLITHPYALAHHLKVTPGAIYKYIKANKLPGTSIIEIANFYNLEIMDLMHLTQSAENPVEATKKPKIKPRATLPTLLKVQAGELTAQEAAEALGIHYKAVTSIMAQWGSDISLLYNTLESLDQGEFSIQQAADALQVSKITLHKLRRLYGYGPSHAKEERPDRPIVARKKEARALAIDAIAGRVKLSGKSFKSLDAGISARTVMRMVAQMSPEIQIMGMSAWPNSYRVAYAEEIDRNLPKMVLKLWEFVENAQISLKKDPKAPKVAQNFRVLTGRQMLIQVLFGYFTLAEMAENRGGEVVVLASIFNSELLPLGLTWNTVTSCTPAEQLAIAETLVGIETQTKPMRQRIIEAKRQGEAE